MSASCVCVLATELLSCLTVEITFCEPSWPSRTVRCRLSMSNCAWMAMPHSMSLACASSKGAPRVAVSASRMRVRTACISLAMKRSS
eukprot:1991955-Prymnesium_polylepis.1